MDHNHNKPAERISRAPERIRVQDLYGLETYFRNKGGSEFVYDEELDVFRFPEDGRIAFCREFADWGMLVERGYIDL